MEYDDMTPSFKIADRVQIDRSIQTMPALPSYVGTIRQIIPSYVDNSIGYNVSLDDDPRPNRLWFFLQAQLSPA